MHYDLNQQAIQALQRDIDMYEILVAENRHLMKFGRFFTFLGAIAVLVICLTMPDVVSSFEIVSLLMTWSFVACFVGGAAFWFIQHKELEYAQNRLEVAQSALLKHKTKASEAALKRPYDGCYK